MDGDVVDEDDDMDGVLDLDLDGIGDGWGEGA